jgi:hypothetical protein
MRLRAGFVVVAASCLLAPSAAAQYAPRLSTGLEFGPELILADDRLSLSGAFQTPLGRQSDVRAALGIEDPDVSSSSAILSMSMRAFLSDVTRGKVLPALQGQLDFFFGGGNSLRLTGGPSFGVATGVDKSLMPYVQPIFFYKHESGKNDVKLGVRLGADYAMKPGKVDLRGDLLISSFLQLRGALAFHIGKPLFNKNRPPLPPPAPAPTPPAPGLEAPPESEAPADSAAAFEAPADSAAALEAPADSAATDTEAPPEQ